jgi:hypothetical protein
MVGFEIQSIQLFKLEITNQWFPDISRHKANLKKSAMCDLYNMMQYLAQEWDIPCGKLT